MAANRLPVEVDADGQFHPSPGGLASALSSVTAAGTHWVGWAGPEAGSLKQFDYGDLRLHPVSLSADEVDRYYRGFANAILWPLFHGRLAQGRAEAGMVAFVPDRQPAVCDRGHANRPARRNGVGSRLPPAARPGHDPSQASGPAHRPVPAHPVPERAAVLDAAVAQRSHQGDARRRRPRVPGRRRRHQLRGRRRPPGRRPNQRAHVVRRGACGRRRCVPDLRRLRPLGRARREGRRRSGPASKGARRRVDLPRHRPARLHQRDLATTAGVR